MTTHTSTNTTKINIHVVISKETIPYFTYLIANYCRAAKHPGRLVFHAYALDPEAFSHFEASPDVSTIDATFQRFTSYRKKTLAEWRIFLRWLFLRQPQLGGSNGHAAGLQAANLVISRQKGHHIIADADTSVLSLGWDSTLCDLFERYDLIGAPYEPIGGFSSGKSKTQTYKNFPTAVWVALRAGHPWHEMDWWPAKETNLSIETPVLARTYKLPQGYELVRDVGWALCDFASSRGLKALAFDHVKASDPRVHVLRTGTDYNEEYQLDGAAFVGHQRGSSRNEFRKTDLSKRYFECVEQAVGKP